MRVGLLLIQFSGLQFQEEKHLKFEEVVNVVYEIHYQPDHLLLREELEVLCIAYFH